MPSFTFKTDANFTFVFPSYSSKRENGKCKIRTTEKMRIIFEKRFKRKQYEIQNSLQNKAAESRKHRKIVISEKKKKEKQNGSQS